MLAVLQGVAGCPDVLVRACGACHWHAGTSGLPVAQGLQADARHPALIHCRMT